MTDDIKQAMYELYKEFCRLKGYQLPTSPIEELIDKSTGVQEAHMVEFVQWFHTDVLPRIAHA